MSHYQHYFICQCKPEIIKKKPLTCIKIQLRHLHSIHLTILLAEAENYDGREISLHNHLDNFKDVGLVVARLRSAATTALVAFAGISRATEHLHSSVEVVFFKTALKIKALI